MKDYELLEQQVRVMKMAEKHGIDDWRKLVKVLHSGSYVDLSVNHVFNRNYTYRFALGIVEGNPVFEGDVLYYEGSVFVVDTTVDENWKHWTNCSWNPPKKNEPASSDWRDVYRLNSPAAPRSGGMNSSTAGNSEKG